VEKRRCEGVMMWGLSKVFWMMALMVEWSRCLLLFVVVM
jgi:hypothetical protein